MAISEFSKWEMTVTTIDRESGILTVKGFNFLNNNSRNERKGVPGPGALFTYKNKDQQATNPEAWVVLNKLVKGKIYPIKITGDKSTGVFENMMASVLK